jgi:hypothetical protein
MKDRKKNRERDAFLAPAQRAFRRVARRLRAENARLGLPLIVGENGKIRLVQLKTARTSAR